MKKILFVFIYFWIFINQIGASELKLSNIFGDCMVIQRDNPINVWGWAEPEEIVTVEFAGNTASTKVNGDGTWSLTLPSLPAGGPYKMLVQDKNTRTEETSNAIVIRDILIGDVWLCGGQSNMEWSVNRFKWADEEIEKANFSNIRLLNVPNTLSGKPQHDIKPTSWKQATGRNIADFSAVGYLFGKYIYEQEQVPLGLISSNWGGTNVEAWTPAENLREWPHIFDLTFNADDENLFPDMNELKDRVVNIRDSIAQQDPGLVNQWYKNPQSVDWSGELVVPFNFQEDNGDIMIGSVWLYRSFDLPTPFRNRDIRFNLGLIKSYCRVWINGELQHTSFRDEWVNFSTPSKFLKNKDNQIVMQMVSPTGFEGLTSDPYYYNFHPVEDSKGYVLLSGDWNMRKGFVMESVIDEPEIPVYLPRYANKNPSSLYNAMIHPLLNMQLSGVIWYQGESNAGRAYEYRALFPNLITSWREAFNDEFPFIFVQLANFRAAVDTAGDSDWAELREAQAMALELPKTGMAVAIDVGDADDVHPQNKHEVALRLALNAFNLVYDRDVVYSGPSYRSHYVVGDTVVVIFEHEGSGLEVRHDQYGYVKGFAVAGADRRFYFAQADIKGNTVKVYSDKVASPVALRYAWADNPDDANLYNKEGLPAVPFRTDDWSGITCGEIFNSGK